MSSSKSDGCKPPGRNRPDGGKIDERLLRIFVTVARTGGLTGAGRLLGHTQPTISIQIQQLEALLGVSLLSRSPHHLALTAAGEEALVYAEDILGRIGQLRGIANRQARQEWLRLGVPEEVAETDLPDALAAFAAACPRVGISLTTAPGPVLRAQVHEGALDLAVIDTAEPSPGGGRPWPLAWVAVPTLAVPIEDPVPLVTLTDGCLYRRQAITALSETKRAWEVTAAATGWEGLRAAVRAGLGVAAVPAALPVPGLRVLGKADGLPPLQALSVVLLRAATSRTPGGDHLAAALLDTLARTAEDIDCGRI